MKRSKTLCPMCEEEVSYQPAIVRRTVGGRVTCACGHKFKPEPIKRGRTEGQRRSVDQEKRSASRNQARRVPGSGSSARAKGDVKDPGRLHGECKHTTRKTFTLKLDDLLKAEREAGAEELVLFEVEFQSVYPHRRFVVLSDDVFQTLVARAEEEE